MKKALALITSAALALSMASSFAFVIGPSGTDTSQMSLKSVKAVDIAVGVEGVRSYADIVDTSRIYQANEIINIATVLEVKNRAFEPTLASIHDKQIVLTVTSSTADLAYANYAPSVISAVQTATVQDPRNILTFSDRISSDALAYTTGSNSVDVKLEGYEVSTSGQDPDNGLGMGPNYGIGRNFLQDYKATATGNRVKIPALLVNDYDMGTYTLQAPRALEYTIITTGLTKDATSGDMEAKLRITGAEAFENVGWVPFVNGVNDATLIGNLTRATPFNKVSKLVIKNNYVVFKLDTVRFLDARSVRGGNLFELTNAAAGNQFVEHKKYRVNTTSPATPAIESSIDVGTIDGQSISPTNPAQTVELTSGTRDNGNYRDPYSFSPTDVENSNIVAYMIFRYDGNAGDVTFDPALVTASNEIGAAAITAGNVGSFVMTLYTEESPNPGYLSTRSLLATSFLDGNSASTARAINTTYAKEALAKVRTLSTATVNGVPMLATALGVYSGAYNTAARNLDSGAQGAMRAAASFFGIDATFGWTGGVKNSHFESKGAPATYSEAITGTYNYGTISIIEEVVEENTDEVDEDLGEDDELVDEDENGGDDIIDEDDGFEDEDDDEVEVVAPTGDFSSNIALALIASSLVAAAALAFVTKKAR